MTDVKAATPWRTNADLIVSCRTLGYLRDDWVTLDPTYGRGTFWNLWRPKNLRWHDLKLDGVDFRQLPYPDHLFEAITFDPPYKLNGTPTAAVDERYGVDAYASREDRHDLIRAGMKECHRVLHPGGSLLVKCQDQVNGGRVRWQTIEFANYGVELGLELVDMLHMLGGRPQPAGRRQEHARRNYSTMLVFRAPKAKRGQR